MDKNTLIELFLKKFNGRWSGVFSGIKLLHLEDFVIVFDYRDLKVSTKEDWDDVRNGWSFVIPYEEIDKKLLNKIFRMINKNYYDIKNITIL